MREERPHRPARSAAGAAAELRNEVRAGRLDSSAVEAVLRSAGHRPRRRPERPAGLSAREVEVLKLVARGLSTKEIANRLSMSPKTAGNHIEHIYTKIGATNRAAASLFAVHHGVIVADEDHRT
jgi:DNA-binding CsgD family transcriptional regulator